MGPALPARARQPAPSPADSLPEVRWGQAGWLHAVERGPVQGHRPGELRLFVGPIQLTDFVPGELSVKGTALGVIETITRYLADTIILVEL